MKRILTAIVFALLLPTTAGAGPIYHFKVTEVHPAPDLGYEPIGGHPFAVGDTLLALHLARGPRATFQGDGCTYEAEDHGGIGIFDLCFGEYDAYAVDIDYDLRPNGQGLLGRFFMVTWEEGWEMVSGPDGIWSGAYGTDMDGPCFGHLICGFDGVWQRVSRVSEPGSLVLMLTALAGLVAAQRARREAIR